MPPPPSLRLVSNAPAPSPPVTPVTPSPGPRIAPRPRPVRERTPLGQILVEAGALDPGDLLKAVAIRDRQDIPLGDILLAHGWVSEADLTAALALQWNARAVDLLADRPDPRLIDRLGADRCLKAGLLPWRRAGGATVIATARPADFAAQLPGLTAVFGPCVMAIAAERDMHRALLATRQTRLARRAESRVPAHESCRDGAFGGRTGHAGPIWLTVALALAAGLAAAPVPGMAALLILALLILVAWSALRLAALVAMIAGTRRKYRAPLPEGVTAFPPVPRGRPMRLPVISVMVPLFREDDIAGRLIARLGRLDYPKELLDVLLVVEEDDGVTRDALAGTRLPWWMRVVTVPRGPVQTKPRALNFALDFCRGAVIGVYDAEDAPARDQLHRVARGFAEAAPDVACLQGVLDFYNPRTNAIARLFTIEYAAWFRVLLPGLARLGLVVPLGGTTLFFRRDVLERLGGWDAHNVTEDADLGLRLARHGYRTELIDTVTEEEANCRPIPWIRQRSRWQKGFLMTWAVHSRTPRRLWRDLGPRRFIAIQVMLAGSVLQALFAPLLWSFWFLAAGLPHPLAGLLPPVGVQAMVVLFVASEAIGMACGFWATRGAGHRHLWPFVPFLHLYNMLATLSGWKAVQELFFRPFFWDKTAHGIFDAGTEGDQAGADPAALPA